MRLLLQRFLATSGALALSASIDGEETQRPITSIPHHCRGTRLLRATREESEGKKGAPEPKQVKVGDTVKARWQGGANPKWQGFFDCEITNIHADGTCDLRFDPHNSQTCAPLRDIEGTAEELAFRDPPPVSMSCSLNSRTPLSRSGPK